MAFRNHEDGNEGSISLIRLYRFEPLHHAFVSSLVSLSISCLVADKLIGSLMWSRGGSSCVQLDPCSAALFASLSAASLPIEPIWPTTQLNSISRFVWFGFAVLMASSIRSFVMPCLIASMRY